MANRPARASAPSAGPDWGQAGQAGRAGQAGLTGPAGRAALAGADAPPPVHHQGYPPQAPYATQAAQATDDPRLAHDPTTPRTHRATPDPRDRQNNRQNSRQNNRQNDRQGHRQNDSTNDHPGIAATGLGWLPYLIVLASVALGLAVAWRASRLAVRGTDLVGGALLLAAVARLLLPARYAGPLSSRGKATDVAGFAVFGAAVLVVALMLS